MRWMRIFPLIALGAAAAAAACDGQPVSTSKSGGIAPARDGNIAIQEELDAARKAGTLEAYDLFIARHPGHRLVETARRERAALAEGKRSGE